MVKRVICCCNTSCWAKVIGWVFTVINALLTLGTVSLIILFILGHHFHWEFKFNSTGSAIYEMIVENLRGYDKYVITLVYLFLLLLSHVIGCTTGGLLLYGTYKMKPKYILTWIIYAVVWGIFEIVAEIIGCNVARNNNLGSSIGVIVIVLVKTTLCVWVVYNHLKETQLSVEYSKHPRQMRLE